MSTLMGCTRGNHTPSSTRRGREIHLINGHPPLFRCDIETALPVISVGRKDEKERKSGLQAQNLLGPCHGSIWQAQGRAGCHRLHWSDVGMGVTKYPSPRVVVRFKGQQAAWHRARAWGVLLWSLHPCLDGETRPRQGRGGTKDRHQ